MLHLGHKKLGTTQHYISGIPKPKQNTPAKQPKLPEEAIKLIRDKLLSVPKSRIVSFINRKNKKHRIVTIIQARKWKTKLQ